MKREYAKGTFMDGHVLIPNEADASRLRSRGRFGRTVAGGGLRLDFVESLYLLEEGRLRLKADHSELLEAGYAVHPDFGARFLAYTDLRSRGLALSSSRSVTTFDMFPRGADFGEASDTAVVVASERSVLSFDAVRGLVSKVLPSRVLLYSIVDDEGDVTHYSAFTPELSGDWETDIPGGEITVLEDRGIIKGGPAADLFDGGFFGRRMGPRTILSLLECAYLGNEGMDLYRGGRRIGPKAVLRRAARLDPAANLKFQAYSGLRGLGLIPKTGFKFGSHFRVYDTMPRTKRESDRTHARYLVQVVPRHFKATWEEISRAVRLSHGVRKEMIYMAPPRRFLRIERVRP